MAPKALPQATRRAKPSTVGGWLERVERLYARHGAVMGQVAAHPRDEALYLLLWALGLSLDSPASVLGRRVGPAQAAKIEEVFNRRLVQSEPAAYITGEAWLGGLRFHVDRRVLIPRSYFVEIIPGQLDGWLAAPSAVRRVADVCTGSGCLAILLARHFPKARVDGIDLSSEALEVARLNVRAHRLSRSVTLVESDVFDAAPPGRYEVILSNPPYEPTAVVDGLSAEFRREPRLALDGGGDGLAIIRKIVAQAGDRLAPGGILLMEVGGLREAIDREFAALDPHWLHTEDGADCVCVISEMRLRTKRAARRASR